MKRPLVLLAAIALVGAGALAWAGQSGRAVERLTAEAQRCGFEHPSFRLHDGAYELNETDVSGIPNPPLDPQQRRNWDRIRLVRVKWMPCLQQAAKAMGLRVTYEKMVIVN